MGNSRLVEVTKISPNKHSPRKATIDTITIHCVVGQSTAESVLNWLALPSTQASCNYVVDKDGRVGMGVEEKDRSWCSSSSSNDNRAITIEVASDKTHPYAVNSKAYEKLLLLLVDICQRNPGINRLKWVNDKNKIGQIDLSNMTLHRWFANKSCPGDYLVKKHPYIVNEVNNLLINDGFPVVEPELTKIEGEPIATVKQMESYIKAKNPSVAKSVIDMIPLYLSEGKAENIRGDIAFAQSCLETGNFGFIGSAVTLDQNNFCGMGVTTNGMKGNSFPSPQIGIRAQIQHLKAYANKESINGDIVDPRFKYVTRGCAKYVEWLGQKENPDGKGWAVGAGYGQKILNILNAIIKTDEVKPQPSQPAIEPYLVKVTSNELNIRAGASTMFKVVGSIKDKGVYTIVEESSGQGASKWGKLKSGVGWISLDYTIPHGTPVKPSPAPVTPSKPANSLDDIVKEVIAGKWGNNPERAKRLTAAGHDAAAVQKRVNEMLKKK